MQVSLFNPTEPGFAEYPFDQYDRIREGDRIQQAAFGPLLVHRYRDCATLLRDPTTSVNAERAADLFGDEIAQLTATRSMNDRRLDLPSGDTVKITGDQRLVIMDPPDHTRVRRIFSRTFTNSRVDKLRPKVEAAVEGLLDGMAASAAEGDPVDLISGFAFPLPYSVIKELLGLPDGGMEVPRWATTLASFFIEPFCTADDAEVAAAGEGMSAYLGAAIDDKRRNPGDDLLSAMVAVEEEGARLTTGELIEQSMMLFVAGHETTVNFLGNSVVGLLRHRDQFERLVAEPAIDVNAIDELLRWDAVQATRRITLKDLDLGDGHVLPAGKLVIALLGAANRDPAYWGPDAGRIDLCRPKAGTHLSFGSGIHHCLGAALARLEGLVAIPRLCRRFPDMTLAGDDLPWRKARAVIRGVDSLPLALDAA